MVLNEVLAFFRYFGTATMAMSIGKDICAVKYLTHAVLLSVRSRYIEMYSPTTTCCCVMIRRFRWLEWA